MPQLDEVKSLYVVGVHGMAGVPVYPIVSLDGIVVHVRGKHGKVSQHTMYVALGLN